MSTPTKATRARSETERRRAFFYAESEASLYDAAADLNTPLFSVMQRTLFELVRQFGSTHATQHMTPLAVLDIGSGTGAESIPILNEFQKSYLVAFDLCEPMHEIFRKKVASAIGEQEATRRCQYITGDIATEAGSVDALLAPLALWNGLTSYDLVVSALALHHLTTDEKRTVYDRIFSVLRPGGLFINADIFSYASPKMARSANDFGINWIRRQFTDPDHDLRDMRDALGDRAIPMMEAWIDHYVNYNLPDPIESNCDNSNEKRVIGQAEMLRNAGFSEVECPFRYWEVGILWAMK